jgi:ribosome-binding ATPase YchF (GTP1/OBG family)
VDNLRKIASDQGASMVIVSAQVESEIMQLEKAERKIFLDDLGVSGSGLESLVSSALLLCLLLNNIQY